MYDFYSASQRSVIWASIFVRLPSDAELQQYFGPEDEWGSSDAADDDEDSNAEDDYKNDFPDGGRFPRGVRERRHLQRLLRYVTNVAPKVYKSL